MTLNDIIQLKKAVTESSEYSRPGNLMIEVYTENGFKINVIWDHQRNWIHCRLYFDPNWPHEHNIYAATMDEAIKQLDEDMNDFNGGRGFYNLSK